MVTLSLPRIGPRNPHEKHRAASSLELFFDLVFVIAVSMSSQALHHQESEGAVLTGAASYLMVFFAIWWAWMNFTWFATAFDTDDWLYRTTTIVQMGGVMILAAGAAPALEHSDFTLVTMGYVVMRLAMVSQWIRVAVSSADYRATALRYAAGITVVQIGWVLRLFLPEEVGLLSFLVLVACELAVPILAERRNPTPWHNEHIAERFGSFTLIVLGESLLASTVAVVEATHETDHVLPLVGVAAAALIIIAGMWWIYFAVPQHDRLGDLRNALTFGYTHFMIFATAGALSAGIEIATDMRLAHTELDETVAASLLTVPVCLFVLSVWALLLRPKLGTLTNVAIPALAALIGLAAFTPWPEFASAALVVVIVIVLVVVAPGRRPSLA